MKKVAVVVVLLVTTLFVALNANSNKMQVEVISKDSKSQMTTETPLVPNSTQDECAELKVSETAGFWYLKCFNSCDKTIKATCKWEETNINDGTTKTHTKTVYVTDKGNNVVASGNSRNSKCKAIDVTSEFVD